MQLGLAALCVAIGAAILGLGGGLVRMSELGPQATAFWRFAFALPILALALAFVPGPAKRASRPKTERKTYWFLAAGGVCFGLDIAFWHVSLDHTSIANSTLMTNMTPIIAGIAGIILFRERPGIVFFLAAGAAVFGAALLSFSRSSGLGLSGAQGAFGDLLALAAAFWYALYLVVVRATRATASVFSAMFVTTAAAGCVSIALALAFHEALVPQTLRGWAVLIGLGMAIHVGGQGLIALGLRRLPITAATLILFVQPLVSALIGWIWFDEPMGPLAFLGAGMVLSGVFAAQIAANRLRFGAKQDHNGKEGAG